MSISYFLFFIFYLETLDDIAAGTAAFYGFMFTPQSDSGSHPAVFGFGHFLNYSMNHGVPHTVVMYSTLCIYSSMYFFFRTTVAEAPPVENAVQYILYSVLAILCAVKVECVIYHIQYAGVQHGATHPTSKRT